MPWGHHLELSLERAAACYSNCHGHHKSPHLLSDTKDARRHRLQIPLHICTRPLIGRKGPWTSIQFRRELLQKQREDQTMHGPLCTENTQVTLSDVIHATGTVNTCNSSQSNQLQSSRRSKCTCTSANSCKRHVHYKTPPLGN